MVPRHALLWLKFWIPERMTGFLSSLPHAALLALGCAGSAVAFLNMAGLHLSAAPTFLCLALGGATALLAYRDYRWKGAAESLAAQAGARSDLERHLSAQALSLKSQVEILTAMREVSRLTAEEAELDRLGRAVFQILADLMGAEEITLFLRDRETGIFVPHLHRVGEAVLSAGDITARTHGELVARGKALAPVFLREAEGQMLYFTVPLIAEGEPLGALRLGFAHEDPGEAIQELEQKEYVVKDLAKHIALAVKAPILRARALTDGLTGLFTKRHFEERLAHDVDEADRYGTPLSLVMVDIDHFKRINDTHGHQAGDAVLRRVGQILRESIRDTDSAYRYGGEEMAVLLPGSDVEKAEKAAERIRKKIEKEPFRISAGETLKVTASLGVSTHGSTLEGPADVVRAADTALYEAKHGGRNRTCVASVPSSPEKPLDCASQTVDTRSKP